MVYQEHISLATDGNGDMQDLTQQVKQIVHKAGIQIGMVNVFNVGSTGAIGAIEYEPGLQRDLPELLNKLIPSSLHYGHEQTWHDGNGGWLGPSLTVPIAQGNMVLGTWQQIFHLECDIKPRQRQIMVTVYGE